MSTLLHNIPIAAIDFDLIIGMIVLFSIIGRLIGAKKKKDGADPSSDPESATEISDTQAELQEFLNSLTGIPQETKPTPPPVTPPQPPPPPPVKPQPIQAQVPQKKPQPAKPKVIVSPAPPPPPVRVVAPTLQKQKTKPPAPPKPRPVKRPINVTDPSANYGEERSDIAILLNSELDEIPSLRKAMLLKEILDRPLALR